MRADALITGGRGPSSRDGRSADRYKWTALTNTTAAVFMSALDGSIVLIALPAIFTGIHLDPLAPGNIVYLLWMIMGYRLVQAVLVVTVGRLGDMFGRVRIYNGGFAVFTIASILLSIDPFDAVHAAMWLIGWRLLQAAGGSMLQANSAAILTDAFPEEQRGFALGINQVAALAGQFIGLVAGGLLAAVDWRAVFWVNVPVGVFFTVWAYRTLRDDGRREPARIDWWGNLTFAVGLSAILVSATYGLQPYGGHTMGWTRPLVLTLLGGGVVLLVAFVLIENRIAAPMIQLGLFRIRAFTAGNLAGLFIAIGRGGMQFILIIWLQGIWLPLHGYDYTDTPLWAGIFLLPLTAGFLAAGPVSGYLSDRLGSRGLATAGALLFAGSLLALALVPIDFSYWIFAVLIAVNGGGVRHVRLAELVLDHGQRPGPPARRRLRHARDLPEQRHRRLDRGVLLAHDRRSGQQPAAHPHRRTAAARRAGRGRRPRRIAATRLLAVRRPARREPDPAPAAAHRRAARPHHRPAARAHRPDLFPHPDLRTVPLRPGRRLRVRRRTRGARRAGVGAARTHAGSRRRAGGTLRGVRQSVTRSQEGLLDAVGSAASR